MMFHKILAAIDQSECSRIVFEQAFTLAKNYQAELMLLHIIAPFERQYLADAYPYYVGIPQVAIEVYLKYWYEQQEAGVEKLRSLQAEAIAAGVSTELTQSIGDPAKQICALSETWKADLIVVGRRGLRGFNEFLLGSVSSYVLHHARCSVLLIQTAAQA